MAYSRKPLHRRFLILPGLGLLLFSACTSWSEIDTGPDAGTSLPSPARITMDRGDSFELIGARIEEDSLIGYGSSEAEVGRDETANPPRVALPLEEVARIERRQANTLLTGVGVAVGAGAVLAGAIVLAVAVGY